MILTGKKPKLQKSTDYDAETKNLDDDADAVSSTDNLG